MASPCSEMTTRPALTAEIRLFCDLLRSTEAAPFSIFLKLNDHVHHTGVGSKASQIWDSSGEASTPLTKLLNLLKKKCTGKCYQNEKQLILEWGGKFLGLFSVFSLASFPLIQFTFLLCHWYVNPKWESIKGLQNAPQIILGHLLCFRPYGSPGSKMA